MHSNCEEMQMRNAAYTLLLANLRTSLLIFDMSPWLCGIFHVEWSTSYCIIERRIIISVQLPLSNATWSSWHIFLNALIFLTILIIRLTATAVKLINDNSCGSSGFFSAWLPWQKEKEFKENRKIEINNSNNRWNGTGVQAIHFFLLSHMLKRTSNRNILKSVISFNCIGWDYWLIKITKWNHCLSQSE